ncbi:hypothetical protein ACFXNW_10775 [Nocardia sp. NPDC059180]|uniref:hypothetical protein n=1 Tax=Nocardia sp. NPDC059180 TaxID=3346761 RepID=UPI0036C9DDF1
MSKELSTFMHANVTDYDRALVLHEMVNTFRRTSKPHGALGHMLAKRLTCPDAQLEPIGLQVALTGPALVGQIIHTATCLVLATPRLDGRAWTEDELENLYQRTKEAADIFPAPRNALCPPRSRFVVRLGDELAAECARAHWAHMTKQLDGGVPEEWPPAGP